MKRTSFSLAALLCVSATFGADRLTDAGKIEQRTAAWESYPSAAQPMPRSLQLHQARLKAQPPTDRESQAVAANEITGIGEIRGRVRVAGSGLVVPDAYLTLYDSNGIYRGGTSADDAGRYAFTGLDDGEYFVYAAPNRWHGNSELFGVLYDDARCPGGVGLDCTVDEGTAISVSGELVQGIDFALPTGSRITGSAVDTDTGAGIYGIAYLLTETGAVLGQTSVAGGEFTIGALEEGSYRLRVQGEYHKGQLFGGGACDFRSDDTCDVLSGGLIRVTDNDVTLPALELSRFGGARGRVLADGIPAANTIVEVRNQSTGERLDSVRTDTDGYWYLDGVPDAQVVFISSRLFFRARMYDDVECPDRHAQSCDLSLGLAQRVEVRSVLDTIDFAFPAAGTVSGTVTSSIDGAPLDNARVEIYDHDATYHDEIRTAWTDQNGRYSVTMGPGAYRITATFRAFSAQIYNGTDCDGSCDITVGDDVIVESELVTGNIDFALDPAPSIAGTVLDTSAQPVPDLWVCAYNASYSFFRSIECGSTDQQGQYRIVGLPSNEAMVVGSEGTESLESQLWNNHNCGTELGNCAPEDGDPIELAAGQQLTNVDLNLRENGRVEGVVSDANGPLTSGAQVAALHIQTNYFVASVNIDENGQYALSLPAGDYRIEARSSLHVNQRYDSVDCPAGGCDELTGAILTLTPGSQISDIDFSLKALATIEGHVVNTGGEPVGGRVEVWSEAGNRVATDYPSASDGSYLISVPPNNNYYLTAQHHNYVTQIYDGLDCTVPCDPLIGTAVRLNVGETLEANFVLTSEVSLSGQIIAQSTGDGIADARIQLRRTPQGYAVAETTTRADGAYDFLGVSTGTYYVVALADDYFSRAWPTHPCEPCDDTYATTLTLGEDSVVTDVNISLFPRTGVSGSVVATETGEPLEAWVRALDLSGQEIASFVSSSVDGAFDSNVLAPGEYVLMATDQGRVSQLFDNVDCNPNCPPEAGVQILIGEGASDISGIDFSLKPRGDIRGSVVDAASRANFSGADATLYRDGQYVDRESIYNGEFSFDKLFSGDYTVVFSHDEYIDEWFDDLACNEGNCDRTSATLINVRADVSTDLGEIDLQPLGKISGRVTAASGTPLQHFSAFLWTAEGALIETVHANSGTYTFRALENGSYYVTVSSSGHLSELYDDVPCEGGILLCDLPAATPIVIEDYENQRNVDFALTRTDVSAIEVYVVDRMTDLPADTSEHWLYVFNEDGTFRASRRYSQYTLDGPGLLRLELDPGRYFVAIDASGFEPRVLPDLACERTGYQELGCPLIDAELIELAEAQTVERAIGLYRLRGISGQLYEEVPGQGLAGSAIDIWDADGDYVTSVGTASNGGFSVILNNGFFLLSTDNGYGLIDQVYNNIECPDGPAIRGLCSLSRGTRINVTGTNPIVLPIQLSSEVDVLFSSGFE